MAPDGFDIIVDDASHIGEFTKQSFWYLFDNHLKPGGLYVIEDWCTGYFDGYPDGKQMKLQEGFLSKLRSGWRPHFAFLVDIPVMLARKFLSESTRPAFLTGDAINHAYFGLLSRNNPFLRVPFESHTYGMVGFVKQLIDEQGAGRGGKTRFLKMVVTDNMVCVFKAGVEP
jgi:hypothetical protein